GPGARRPGGARTAPLVPADFEQILGGLARNRAGRDQVEDRAELLRRHRRAGDVSTLLVEPAREFVDAPVGDNLGVAALRDRLEEAGCLPLGNQNSALVPGETVLRHEAPLLLVRHFGA